MANKIADQSIYFWEKVFLSEHSPNVLESFNSSMKRKYLSRTTESFVATAITQQLLKWTLNWTASTSNRIIKIQSMRWRCIKGFRKAISFNSTRSPYKHFLSPTKHHKRWGENHLPERNLLQKLHHLGTGSAWYKSPAKSMQILKNLFTTSCSINFRHCGTGELCTHLEIPKSVSNLVLKKVSGT